MDSITQILLATTITEAGFREKLGTKAIVFGGFCGLFPDLDILYTGLSGWDELLYHRSLSHCLLFLLCITPILGYLGYLWDKKRHYLSWTHLAFWALLTHSLLDICTSYGTQFWYPFSNQRLTIDAVAVIDPAYSIPLVIALVLSVTIKISRRFSRNFSIAMLVVTTGYLALGYCQSQYAIAKMQQKLANENIKVRKIRAVPTLLNIFLWRTIAVDTKEQRYLAIIATSRDHEIEILPLNTPQDSRIETVRNNKYGKIFSWFTDEMIAYSIHESPQGSYVYIQDLRFGFVSIPQKTIFNIRGDFDHEGNLVDIYRLPTDRKADIAKELVAMRDKILGE